MTVKTITITEEAYNAIKSLKRPDESFSELFNRIGSKPTTFEIIRGSLKKTPEEMRDWHKRLRDIREQMSKDMEARIKDVRSRLERIN